MAKCPAYKLLLLRLHSKISWICKTKWKTEQRKGKGKNMKLCSGILNPSIYLCLCAWVGENIFVLFAHHSETDVAITFTHFTTKHHKPSYAPHSEQLNRTKKEKTNAHSKEKRSCRHCEDCVRVSRSHDDFKCSVYFLLVRFHEFEFFVFVDQVKRTYTSTPSIAEQALNWWFSFFSLSSKTFLPMFVCILYSKALRNVFQSITVMVMVMVSENG